MPNVTPTHDELIANIKAMETQGAQPQEIQQYLDRYKGQTPGQPMTIPQQQPLTPDQSSQLLGHSTGLLENAFKTPLNYFAEGQSQQGAQYGVGAAKQLATDISMAGAQHAGPVGQQIMSDALARGGGAAKFAGAIQSFGQQMQPSNIEQQKGAFGTTMAEMAAPFAVTGTLPSQAIRQSVSSAKQFLGITPKAASEILPEAGVLPPEKSTAFAWEDIKPTETTKTKTAYAQQGSITPQKGLFGRAELAPTESDKNVINTLAPLYENGTLSPKMDIAQKMDAIESEAARLHADQKTFLADNNKVVAKTGNDGLFSAIQQKAASSKTVFSKDPVASGAYDSAFNIFKRNLKGAGGKTNLVSIDEALTKFDSEMEQFGAWKKLSTGELTETDRARIIAIRDIHTAARDFIAKELPPNNPWVNIRSNESNLYEAGSRMAPRLGETVGESKWSSWWEKHPVLKRGLLWGGFGAAAALGGGLTTEVARTIRIGE